MAMIGKNTVFTVASNGMQVASRFFLIPIVIFHLGLGGYGIWSVIMATAGYMRFGRYGLKAAFQKYVAEATASGDYETPSRLLSTGSISMLLLSVSGLIPIAMFSVRLAVISGIPPEFCSAAAHSISLLAVMFAASNFGAAYEAIMMGGHRIDLTGKFCLVSMPAEAIAVTVSLHFGYGLFAMAIIMAVGELAYVAYCFLAARRILPRVRINIAHFTPSVFPELLRFAGSYQMANILEVLYFMLVPVTILKHFGSEIAGLYAVVNRLVWAALMAQDASILPLLSAGSTIFAAGPSERVQMFFRKAFKINTATTLAPLAFLAAFGTLIVLAWTGRAGPMFQTTIWLSSLCALFAAISRLQLILYRTSGKALHDNIRQALRLGVVGVLSYLSSLLGFYGLLAGMTLVEFSGVVYMFIAMSNEVRDFNLKMLIPDSLRIAAAVIFTICAGLAVAHLPAPWGSTGRTAAIARLVDVMLACLIATVPAISLTRAASAKEKKAIMDLLVPWRNAASALTVRASNT